MLQLIFASRRVCMFLNSVKTLGTLICESGSLDDEEVNQELIIHVILFFEHTVHFSQVLDDLPRRFHKN